MKSNNPPAGQLEQILKRLWSLGYNEDGLPRNNQPKDIAEAATAIRQAVNEAIGEDEEISIAYFDHEPYELIRNELRAEIRDSLRKGGYLK